jgi:hypothetical protein
MGLWMLLLLMMMMMMFGGVQDFERLCQYIYIM